MPGEKDTSGKEITISYQHLLELEKDGEVEYRPEGMRKRVRVTELLEGVEATEARRLRQAQNPTKLVAAQSLAMTKCKILFLAANPTDTASLALDEQSREIDRKIRAAEHRDSLELITKWAVRPGDLLDYLNQFCPHVVHFSGHGSRTEEIVLLDDARQPKPVAKAALRKLFAVLKDNIRLVVLNACYSQPLGGGDH